MKTPSTSLTIKQVAKDPQPFGNYNYEIYNNEILVARYWHDYRGDGQRLILMNGKSEDPPFGSVSDFMTGGGPKPLGLSAAAIAYLTAKLSLKPG